MSLQEAPRKSALQAAAEAETIARRARLGILPPKPAPRFVPAAPVVDKPSPITLQRIIDMVSDEFGVSVREMRSRAKLASYVTARFAVHHLARRLTPHSYLRIAQSLYRTDHTSVVSGEKRAEALMLVDHDFALSVVTVERRLVESAARYVMADLIVINGQSVDHLTCPHCQRLVIDAKQVD